MGKHALPRSRRLGHLKVVASVALVVAFLMLAVGGATGMIGSPVGDDGDDRVVGVDAPASDEGSDGSSSADPTPTDEPTEVVTDVPPQDVKGAKKLQAHPGLAAPGPGRRDDVPGRLLQRARQLSHSQGRQPQGLCLGLHPDGDGLVADLAGRPLRDRPAGTGRGPVQPAEEPVRLGRIPRADPGPRLDPQLAGVGPRRVGGWSRPTASASPTSAARSSAARSSC